MSESIVCLFVCVCETEREILPCCQDADPVITTFSRGSSDITVPSSRVWLQFLLENCTQRSTAISVVFNVRSFQNDFI